MNKIKYIGFTTLTGFQVLSAFMILSLFISCRETISPNHLPTLEPTSERLEAVHFINESTGFIGGGTRFFSSRIFKTNNQGENWAAQKTEVEFEKIIFDMTFRDEMIGFATAFEGKILKTLNGGDDWQVFQTRLWLPLHGITMVTDSIVVTVGGNGYDFGIIHRSTDLGDTWTMIDTFGIELRDVVFTSSKIGFAAGYGAILKTEDGGLTWDYTTAQREFFSSLSFPSPLVGYAVGRTGTIVKTTDGGESWEKLRNGNNAFIARQFYNKVTFLNEEVGYVVGDGGIILKTVDGGKKWSKFERETKAHLYDIYMFSEGKGIIVGDEGTILHFEE